MSQTRLHVVRSKPMWTFTCGELRAFARSHPSPQIQEKLRHIAPFADHVQVTVQICDIFPAGVPADVTLPGWVGDAVPPGAEPGAASTEPAEISGRRKRPG